MTPSKCRHCELFAWAGQAPARLTVRGVEELHHPNCPMLRGATVGRPDYPGVYGTGTARRGAP